MSFVYASVWIECERSWNGNDIDVCMYSHTWFVNLDSGFAVRNRVEINITFDFEMELKSIINNCANAAINSAHMMLRATVSPFETSEWSFTLLCRPTVYHHIFSIGSIYFCALLHRQLYTYQECATGTTPHWLLCTHTIFWYNDIARFRPFAIHLLLPKGSPVSYKPLPSHK